jgi:tRNA(adenine34) deaminase
MRRALDEARRAADSGEVPVGALVVHKDELVSITRNSKEQSFNPCGHAELLAIQEASRKLSRWRLTGCTLYSTLEPCVMCAGACVQARLDRVVFGAWDAKFGGVESLYAVLSDARSNHRCQVRAGVLRDESAALLKTFFEERRRGARPPDGPELPKRQS